MPVQGFACQICSAESLQEVHGFSELGRVSSDCRPWPAGGRLSVCLSCAAVQKLPDAAWEADAAKIYQDYEVYAQAQDGAEQVVFDGNQVAMARSERLICQLGDAASLPSAGRILDIGCGNGAFLRAFVRRHPTWQLFGSELNAANEAALQRIPGFETLYVGRPERIGARFDLVSSIHSLEHMPCPVDFLHKICHALLEPSGRLVVEVPSYGKNPFDLLVADHLLHFSLTSLANLLTKAELSVVSLVDSWIPKELSLVASLGEPAPPPDPVDPKLVLSQVEAQVAWLRQIASHAQGLTAQSEFGIFGTSISGSWLFGTMPEQVSFFVDEDPSRVGNTYLGRPILSPAQAPAGSSVYVSLAPAETAAKVAGRLDGTRGSHYLAPLGLSNDR